MRVGKYRVNSSVIIASLIAFIGGAVDLLSSGWVVDGLAEVIIYFMRQPESFKPYLTDNIYRALLTFLPIMSIFLRLHRAQGRPPIEKAE